MKKMFFRSLAIAAVAAVAGYNVYQSNSVMNHLSDLALANVEALAGDDEVINDKYCTIHVKCFSYNGQATGKYTADSYTGELCTYLTPHEHSCVSCSSR